LFSASFAAFYAIAPFCSTMFSASATTVPSTVAWSVPTAAGRASASCGTGQVGSRNKHKKKKGGHPA
jgi:hypothetical protein